MSTRNVSKLKSILESRLSYTNEDYASILEEIIELFKGPNPISENWNNMSESDPLFIMFHLLAAHKDILNYMLDYRIREAFMRTALERASLVRNANSFGYKITSYRASRALFNVSQTPVNPVKIKDFAQFIDSTSGLSWTFINDVVVLDDEAGSEDQLSKTVSLGDSLELFQGIPIEYTISINNIDPIRKTHILPNQNIAIGSNYSEKGCSRLVLRKSNENPIIFKEVDNLLDSSNVLNKAYELNVDAQGITYIRFSRAFSVEEYANYTATLYVIATQGSAASSGLSQVVGTGYNSLDEAVEVALLPGDTEEFFLGSLPATPQEIKEGFVNYYASVNTLITIEDIKNFMLNVQKLIPTIDKCHVVDKYDDTEFGTGYDTEFDPLIIGVYLLKENNQELTSTETGLILDLLESKIELPKQVIINNTDKGLNPITGKALDIKTGVAISTAAKQAIVDYINAKPISSELTQQEIYSLLATDHRTDYIRRNLNVTMKYKTSGTYVTSLEKELGRYLTVAIEDIII
jgi:hypothetical protein